MKFTKSLMSHMLIFSVICSLFSLGSVFSVSVVEAVEGTINAPVGASGLNSGSNPQFGGSASQSNSTFGGSAPNSSFGGSQPNPPFGGNVNGQSKPGKFTNPIEADSLADLLTDLLKIVTTLGAIVVVFFFILAGFNYVTARGDESKISSATKTLTWTAVGAAVILGAQVIAKVIQNTVNQLG